MKVSDYTIIQQRREINSLFVFESEIRGLIREGWQPLGPPHIVGADLHVQAMVKPVIEKTVMQRLFEPTYSR